jgi:hypothetical protein
MKINKWIFLSSLLTPTLSYAFFCPTNFNQIDFGNTMDQVQQQCGKPDLQETKEVGPPGPQEWTYFINQTQLLGTPQQSQGTLKTTIDFDKDGKAINITANGIGVGATTICGQNIQLGSTRDAVKAACGEPGFINKQTPADNATPPPKKKVTTFTYNSTPPQKLIFEDGILTSKQ